MLDSIPKILRDRYRFEEREHAYSILAGDFASEWKDLLDCLKAFTLRKGYITKGGGGRSDIPQTLDGFLKERGWSKKRVSELQAVFDDLGIGKKYGSSTTHWDKLIPKVSGGGAGGCPLLLVGLGVACYDCRS